jgi:hypothetical protein
VNFSQLGPFINRLDLLPRASPIALGDSLATFSKRNASDGALA